MKVEMREYKDLTDFAPRYFLQVNTCGIRKLVDHNLAYLRSHGRKDYLILYIKSGTLLVCFEDEEMVPVHAGTCLVYMPGIRQKYLYSTDYMPVALYCHFVGPAADEAMKMLQPRERIAYDISDRTAFEGLFQQLTQVYYSELSRTKQKPIFNLEANGILLQIISMLSRNDTNKSNFAQNKIRVATEYFIKHFRDDIDVDSYAEQLGMSSSHFAHFFSKSVGISPYKFILNLRIDEAKELLIYSQMSIQEIAEQVGFPDASYFSRIFRKYTRSTPSEYRKRA